MRKTPIESQLWFICLMFALSFLVVPLIIGIMLLIQRYKDEKLFNNQFDNLSQLYKILVEKNGELKDVENKITDLYNEKNKILNGLSIEKSKLENEISILTNEVRVKASDISAYALLNSEECKNQIQILKTEQNELIKNDLATKAYEYGIGKRELENNKKQILRCFNAECQTILESINVKNVDVLRGKLQKTYESVNKIFANHSVEISKEYLKSKLNELSLIYSFQVKLDEEKEQQRAIREQMVEEEKVRREIEREKQKIEKEESQFRNEISKLMQYLQSAKDEVQSQLYIDKIRELEDKLKLLEKDKENVLQREQNTRAGFVYIISNIGSFGENVYKIGMTRRLEPMDRIKELGDASVPFTFDVHALIFSEDAPALETILHQTFRTNQVNLVNPRKEFFRIDLEDIKKIVSENHNATVKFIDIPDAYEYIESKRLLQSMAEEVAVTNG